MLFVSHHSHRRENSDLVHDFTLLVGRSPEISNKRRVLHFHHVESLVHSLFLGEEHLVDVDRGDVIVLLIINVKLVEDLQLLSQRRLGLQVNHSCVINTLRDL